MPHKTKQIRIGLLGAVTAFAVATAAHADGYSTSSSYNTPYGMSGTSSNGAVDPSLRDSNGNLELVNGQFLTSSMTQQSGVQNMNPLTGNSLGSQSVSLGSSTSGQVSTGSGVGSMTTVGTATAIGNSLNVVTVGNNNTVVVNSKQVDNGNQTATTTVNGH